MIRNLLVIAALPILSHTAPAQDAPAKTEDAKPVQGATEKKKRIKVPLAILEPAALEKIMTKRLPGGFGYDFAQYANMFFVQSRIDIGYGVGLSCGDDAIAETELQPVFPDFYKPTLKELLDSIALQTGSEWSYRKEDQFITSSMPGSRGPADTFIVHFEKKARKKPYEVALAKGWESDERGHWTACRPADLPVGMDIYELGAYSAKDAKEEPKLFQKVRDEVALEWARRAKPGAKKEELKPAKVGAYDALYFESLIDARSGGKVRWRHWVFMVGNRCYFVVSTIFPKDEKKVYPDVEGMLKSFRIRTP